MPKIVSELIISIDGYARGLQSPAYYGFYGEEFGNWIESKNSKPHRNIMGRKTYEALNSLPVEFQDDSYKKMISTPGWLYSRTLKTTNWNLEIIQTDVCKHIQSVKHENGTEIRTLGSLSLVQQLLKLGLVDILRLIICPLVLPKTGIEPLFSEIPELQFELLEHKVLDGRIIVLDYRPDGSPPYTRD